MLSVWYQAYKMSICGEFFQSRYVYLLSGYIGMHKAVSVERVLSMLLAIPTNELPYWFLKYVSDVRYRRISNHFTLNSRCLNKAGVGMWNVYIRSSRYSEGICKLKVLFRTCQAKIRNFDEVVDVRTRCSKPSKLWGNIDQGSSRGLNWQCPFWFFPAVCSIGPCDSGNRRWNFFQLDE